MKKLGFGLMRLPMIGEEVDIEQTKQMVDVFMQNGFTYFDTAYGYLGGRSEKAVKTAIKRLYNGDYVICEGKEVPAEEAEGLEQTKEAVEAAAEAAVSVLDDEDEDEALDEEEEAEEEEA